ncbi:MAG: HEAT repeat domain-containing protein [Actinomycetota bacterium]|nr:HEAT repeat domain-containing protein [Actinomycetota bacterium]
MNGEESDRVLDDEYERDAVLFVVNLHAATVNMRLYPPTSSMVTETIEKAFSILDGLLCKGERLAISVVENNLVVNGVRLDDTEQSRTPVKSFVAWMTEREISSIDFLKGVTPEELKKLFEILAGLSDSETRANLPGILSEAHIEHITVNQRVYVAISTGDDVAGISGGITAADLSGRKESSLDALKDELLIRYLMGKVSLSDVGEEDVKQIIASPLKVGGLLSKFIEEEGEEGSGILVRSEKAEEALEKLSDMISGVKDESLKEKLSGQVSEVIAEMDPRQMTSVLSGGTLKMDMAHVREDVIRMITDEKLLDIVDALIDEYLEMGDKPGELSDEWTTEHLRNLNEVLLQLKRGSRGETLSDAIDEKIRKAGIQEERDKSTGKRVLSACQILGKPLEEEQIPDLGEGVDENVSRQVCKLLAMGEKDLSSGILLKLVEHLKSEDRSIKRYAASLIFDTWDNLEKLGPSERIHASFAIEPELRRSAIGETDYQVFVFVTDCLAGICALYLKEGLAEEALKILEVLSAQSSPESGKEIELKRHARRVFEGLLGSEGAVSPVQILSEPDREKRARVVKALSKLGPEGIAPIVDLVKDRGQMEFRGRVLEAIGEAGEAGTASLLLELGKDNPWYVYRNLLGVISELRLAGALDQIEAMVSHPDERIRKEAIRAAARIGDKRSLPVVMEKTNDSSASVRMTAVRVLGLFKEPGVGDYLLDIIVGKGPRGKEEEQAIVECACLALGDLNDPAYIDDLAGLIRKGGVFKKGRADEVRAAACVALGNIGHEKAIPALEKAMKDSAMMVRSSAEKSIKKIKGEVTAPQIASPNERAEISRGTEGKRLLSNVGEEKPDKSGMERNEPSSWK